MYLLGLLILMVLVGFIGAKIGTALFHKNNPNTKRGEKINNKKLIVIVFLMSVTLFISNFMNPFSETTRALWAGNSDYKAGKYDEAIAEYTKLIIMYPKIGPTYAFRAKVYLAKGEYDNAWADVYKAEALGYKINMDFINQLKQASGK